MALINLNMLALPTQGLLTTCLVPIGGVIAFAGTTVPAGWLLCDGREVSRAEYHDLFTAIGTLHGDGDGVTTFNLPNLVNRFVEGGSTSGAVKEAGLPNITGKIHTLSTSEPFSPANTSQSELVSEGAFGLLSEHEQYVYNWNSSRGAGTSGITFDASQANLIYGNSATVQPPAVTMLYIIRAVDPLNDSFTFIYPNGGSKSAPANVTINTRYVEANPFPGYHVHCEAEIKVNGKWGEAGWIYNSAAGGTGGYGVKVGEYNNSIVVQTGGNALIAYSCNDGTPFGITVSNYSTINYTMLPCRVKVWKVGRMEADE
jgi:microcystin-dependent protein